MMSKILFTLETISWIERELDVTLPIDYKEVLLTYPFESESEPYYWELRGEGENIVTETKRYRQSDFFGRKWPLQFVVIGGDGCGNAYFLDVSREHSPVYLADHERTSRSNNLEFVEESASIDAWVEEIKKREADIQEEIRMQEEEIKLRKERKKNKKWWQFWI